MSSLVSRERPSVILRVSPSRRMRLPLAARPQAARVEENARLHHFLVELHRLP